MLKSENETSPLDTARNPEPELTSVRKFRSEVGIVPSTFWRWEKRHWISKPINIAGRLYLTREQITEFKRRAAAGEFAASIQPLRPAKENKP